MATDVGGSLSTAGRARVRVGLAGWDYPDWNGIVYPAERSGRFDRLAWIARWVDLIEINSTFYRPVVPRVAASWARRVADHPGFTFTAKVHRSITHESEADLAAAIEATLDGVRPLSDAGRLGCLLVQYPQSFHFDRRATERLDRVAEALAGWPAAVEVRHASWRTERAADAVRRRGLASCLVDQPGVGGTTLGALARVTAPVAYARLHGRNAANWFRPDAGRDARYDYLYTREELTPLADLVRGMAGEAREVYVVQNNHFRGQALANALQMRHLLEGARPEAPEDLVAAYPALAEDVVVRRERLF